MTRIEEKAKRGCVYKVYVDKPIISEDCNVIGHIRSEKPKLITSNYDYVLAIRDLPIYRLHLMRVEYEETI